MNKLLSVFIFVGVGFLVQACAPTIFQQNFSSQEDCGFVQNVYGQRISWKGRLPIELRVHQSFPKEMLPVLEGAIQRWHESSGKTLFKIIETNTPGLVKPRKDGQNIIYWSYEWAADKTDEQARTDAYWVGDEIREADIAFNAKDTTFYTTQALNNTSVDLESVMVHELGHVLGLKHNDSGQSIMGTYLNPLQERREIAKKDVVSIRCEY